MFTITYTRMKPLSQHTVETAIFDTTMQQVEEYCPVQRVKELLDVHIENPADLQAIDHVSHRVQGVMRTASRSKTI